MIPRSTRDMTEGHWLRWLAAMARVRPASCRFLHKSELFGADWRLVYCAGLIRSLLRRLVWQGGLSYLGVYFS
jgi:hypothetical protein